MDTPLILSGIIFRNTFPIGMNKTQTFKECRQPIEAARFFRIIEYIESYDITSQKDQSFYVYGHTFTSRSCLKKLHHTVQIKQFKKQYGLKGFIIPVPSPNSFILKLSSSKVLRDTFNLLDKYIFFNVALFKSSYEKSFLKEFNIGDVWASSIYIKQDPTYFIYGADFDHSESDTGIMEFFSYGKDAPHGLTAFL